MTAAIRAGAIHAAPEYLDVQASTARACALIGAAGRQNLDVVAFGETWISGYPFFAISESPMLRDPESVAQYYRSAIEIPGPETEALCAAAREANLDVVIGVTERDSVTSGTLYCTLLFIGSEGQLLGRHRKLKPTSAERMVWGEGDGSSLRVYKRRYGRLSGLNCWEHQMILPGYTLAAQGTQVHVATWPTGCARGSQHEVLARAFASQAACVVISVGGIYDTDRMLEGAESGAFGLSGASQIIGPLGDVRSVSDDHEGLIVAEISHAEIEAAKALCDIGGHYSRKDIFTLNVNRDPTSFHGGVAFTVDSAAEEID